MRVVLISLLLLLLSCGGGNSPEIVPSFLPCTSTGTKNNASVGSSFVYVDKTWQTVPTNQNIEGKWVVRGTTEDSAYMPKDPVWYTPSNGTTEQRNWWTLTSNSLGIHNIVNKDSNTSVFDQTAYSGSFINDALIDPICIKNSPNIFLDYSISGATGSKTRATVGIVLQDSVNSTLYIEQVLSRTDSWRICSDAKYSDQFDRCLPDIWYFPPSAITNPIDVKSLVYRIPGMTANRADSMRIMGVYIGSEIYGLGKLNMTVSNYSIGVSK